MRDLRHWLPSGARTGSGVIGRTGRSPGVLALLAGALIIAAPLSGGALRGAAVAQNGPKSVAPVAEQLTEAVVNISTSQRATGPSGVPLPDVPKGSPFEEFFDDFFNQPGADEGIERKVSSLGSGFVIDGVEGLVVTNNHVIADADEIYVNFADGSKLKVEKVVGRDLQTDLALLKVTPKAPLKDVKFGVSETLRIGDWVMAIGNPFGLGGTVTVGIISAKARDINSGPYDDYLQTDAAINKGNSGGPLFNMDGEVIGVNTAIISPTGGSIGIGFAIPSDTASNVIEQLKLYGETRRGWLGVRIQSVTEDLAGELGVPENKGALVAATEPGSPAEQAGIQPRDVIVSFDGKEVTTMRGLPRLVAQTPVGKVVPVQVQRQGKSLVVSVTIGRLKEQTAEATSQGPGDEPAIEDADPGPVLGMTLSEITDELRKQYAIDPKVEGVVVISVEPGSVAAAKNIKAGDVIVEAGQDQVRKPSDIAESIEEIRSGGRSAVLLRIEGKPGEVRFEALQIN